MKTATPKQEAAMKGPQLALRSHWATTPRACNLRTSCASLTDIQRPPIAKPNSAAQNHSRQQ